ncbi:hypothetical protein FQA47_023633 [Oryzias melastigma]|uniref:Uncharacterized protein n=1 Tax=Oryzias melastigma TaxID=30732 RepID=A0A834FQ08_ORYME|nr:hypothetical protein FQA47_023633 [Oryzias melastigma]
MLCWTMSWFCFSFCIMLGTSSQSKGADPAKLFPSFSPEQESGDTEGWEWGSGFSPPHAHHSFPGDSPFVLESPEDAFNCTQRFWLPPAPTCWENAAGPEEFAKCRVLILQNRAALQALSTSSGMEEGGSSYNHKAKEEIQGILSEHQNMEDTVKTMEKVFVSLAEKRKEGKEQAILTRMKQHLANTRDGIDDRSGVAHRLERQFFTLEETLLNTQHRLGKFFQLKSPYLRKDHV